MSFPKATIKRFNESTGCAPPPTAYDPKSGEKASGGVVDKSERFKINKDVCPAPGSANTSTVSTSTPIKQLFAPPQSGKRAPKSTSVDTSKIKELEREIKRLLKERVDQDKLLSNKDEEVKKLEGRLHNANSDKCSLQAKLATAEKDLQINKKSNELLKTKVATAENNKKQDSLQAEVASLKQQLQHKDSQINHLNHDLHLAVTALTSILQVFESTTALLEKHTETYGNFVSRLIGCPERENKTKDIKKNKDTADKLKDEKVSVEEKVTLVKKQSKILQERFSVAVTELDALSKKLESVYTATLSKQTELEAALAKVETELKEALDIKKTLEEQKADLLDSNCCLNDKVKELTLGAQNKEENFRMLHSNWGELQEGREALESRLKEVESIHLQARKEDADRILSLEQREIVIQVVTKGLNERIIELQTQNEDLLAALRDAEETLDQTRAQNQNLEETISKLEYVFQEEKNQFASQVTELERQKTDVDNKLCDSEQKLSDSERKLSESELKLNNAEQKLSGLQSDLERQKSESDLKVKELEEQLDTNKSELEQLQNKLGDLVYEKSQLHTEIGHMEAKVKLLNSESDKAREDAEKALGVIPHLKEQNDVLLMEKKETDDQIGELMEQNCNLQGTLEAFQSDFDVYVELAEKDKMESNRVIAGLNEEVEGLKEQKDHMAKELDDWLMEKSELDIDVANLQCRIKVLEMENDQTCSEAEKESKHHKEEVNKLEKEKARLKEELSNKVAEISSLQTEISSKKSENTQLETKNRELEVMVEEKTKEILNYTDQLEETKQLCHSKSDEFIMMEEKQRQFEISLNEQQEQLKWKDTRIAELQEQYNRKASDYTSLVDETGTLKSLVEKHTEKINLTEKQLQDLQIQYDSKCEELDSLTETNERLQGDLSIVSKTMTVIEAKLEQVQEDFTRKSSECDELSQKNKELDTELTLSVREVVDLQERIEALLRYKEFLYDKLISVTYKGYQLAGRDSENEKMQVYEAEIEDLRQQLQFMESHQKEQNHKEEMEKYKTLYEELQARVAPFIEQIDSFDLEKQFLLGRSQATEEEMQKLKQNYCDLLGHQNKKQKIKHIIKLKDENTALRKEVAALREQSMKLQRQIEKTSLSSRGKENAQAKTPLKVRQPTENKGK